MKRIIILSDTHGLLRPEVLEYLPQAAAIIHGGDITSADKDRKARDGGRNWKQRWDDAVICA